MTCLDVILRIFGYGILVPTFSILLISSVFTPAAGRVVLKVGDAFPVTSLPDVDGKQVILPEAAAGKVAIIHFWASWCPLCVKEMNDIEFILTAYREKGVTAYSISAGDSADVARAYVRKSKATYPILLDAGAEATKRYGVVAVPATFVCDRKGVIRYKILGEVNRLGLEKLLTTLL